MEVTWRCPSRNGNSGPKVRLGLIAGLHGIACIWGSRDPPEEHLNVVGTVRLCLLEHVPPMQCCVTKTQAKGRQTGYPGRQVSCLFVCVKTFSIRAFITDKKSPMSITSPWDLHVVQVTRGLISREEETPGRLATWILHLFEANTLCISRFKRIQLNMLRRLWTPSRKTNHFREESSSIQNRVQPPLQQTLESPGRKR